MRLGWDTRLVLSFSMIAGSCRGLWVREPQWWLGHCRVWDAHLAALGVREVERRGERFWSWKRGAESGTEGWPEKKYPKPDILWVIYSELILAVCVPAQSSPTLCDSLDCSPPASSVHAISQARILEWVPISYSRGSSWSRDRIYIFCIGRQILYHRAPANNCSV